MGGREDVFSAGEVGDVVAHHEAFECIDANAKVTGHPVEWLAVRVGLSNPV
jgi:hypothetical protein